MIRAGGTMFYSLSYINSRRGGNTPEYLYPVISIKMERLPGNTKYRLFVDGQSAMSRILGGCVCNAGWPPHPSLNLSPTLKKLGLFFEGGPSCSRLCIWKTHKKENSRGRGGSYDQFGILQKTKPKLKKRNPLHS